MDEKAHVEIKVDPMKLSVGIEDLLDPLHDHVRELEKRIVGRILDRYCGVCFFGKPSGMLMGVPICYDCLKEVGGICDKKPIDGATVFMRMSMRNRDVFEGYYMNLLEEHKKNKLKRKR